MPTEDPKPLSLRERQSWNNFVKFLYQKGYYGSAELDKRDTGLGLKLINEYNQSNQDAVINPDIIPRVQTDFQYLSEKGYFPGEDTLNYVNPLIAGTLKKSHEKYSPVDNWLGSLTSTQAYPVVVSPTHENLGVDYAKAQQVWSEYMGNKKPAFDLTAL